MRGIVRMDFLRTEEQQMNFKNILKEESAHSKYVKSIRDPARRKFAPEYVSWVQAGRLGMVPERGRLSIDAAKLLVINIEAIG